MDCVVPNNISVQLLEEITNDFSEHQMIGYGSYGKVYKGVHKDGKQIAVKLLYGMPGLNDEQFQNEVKYLKWLDHQNIVRLVDCCYETKEKQCSNKKETKEKLINHMGKLVLAEKRYTALCLEYMNNGSLDNYISDEFCGNSWSTRYRIIKGTCEGLKYLHEESKPPIYHLDLKPMNVLLDENMLPKISDFGLSKLFGEEHTQIIRNYRGTERSNSMDCVVANNISVQLLEEITNGFSEDRIIGIGSCGKVYMGVHKDGKKVAVKLLHGMPGLNDDQFQNEFNNLKRLDHQNIVRLVGCCDETKEILINHMGKLVLVEKRYTALCLEYMNNRSLDNYISDEHSGGTWSTRYKIIKGICEGIKYLHEELEPPIYHLDLKPANVLLDENMLPKISDFGLSKLFGEEQTKIIRNDRGTDAYSPPEYKKGGVVSVKYDIFSLGVVIMKIMAGRTGYCKSFDMSSEQFIELVHANWRNRLQERSKCGMDMEIYSAQIKTCIEIAVRCVEYDRNKRPNIGDIVNKLNETEKNVLLEKNITDFISSSLLRIAKHGYSPLISLPKKKEYSPPLRTKEILALEMKMEEVVMSREELVELMKKTEHSGCDDMFFQKLQHLRIEVSLRSELLKGQKDQSVTAEIFFHLFEHLLTEVSLFSELLKGQKDQSESAEIFFHLFEHVLPNGRNSPTPAEDRRRRSGKTRHMKSRTQPAEDRRHRSGKTKTRHMKSSSASSYTLMRNWKY